MFKINDSNIFINYIQQLLYSFNLPTIPVVDYNNMNNFKIDNTLPLHIIIKNFPYRNQVKDSICIYNKGEIKYQEDFIANYPYLNLTKKLKIENNYYTRHVHEYLGEYLRFIRDYYNINLMSMYNCYSENVIEKDNYKYIIIPIKNNQKYTIYLETNNICKVAITENYDRNDYNLDLIEIDGNNQEEIEKWKNQDLYHVTIKKVGFKNPYLLSIPNNYYSYNEKDLKLIIRLPKIQSSSIVVLEGDYTKSSETFNNFVLNYDLDDNQDYNEVVKQNNKLLINQLQLTKEYSKTNNTSYAFADRLIEYLIGNVITEIDPLSKNIIDAKKKFNYRYRNLVNNYVTHHFTDKDRLEMLLAISKNKLVDTNKNDLLGYIDKDVENVLDDERWIRGEVQKQGGK